MTLLPDQAGTEQPAKEARGQTAESGGGELAYYGHACPADTSLKPEWLRRNAAVKTKLLRCAYAVCHARPRTYRLHDPANNATTSRMGAQ